MAEPIDVKHLGKLLEELGELTNVASRCLIHGLESQHPETRKINRLWLEEEIADVQANIALVVQHFDLHLDRITNRKMRKIEFLRERHRRLAP